MGVDVAMWLMQQVTRSLPLFPRMFRDEQRRRPREVANIKNKYKNNKQMPEQERERKKKNETET